MLNLRNKLAAAIAVPLLMVSSASAGSLVEHYLYTGLRIRQIPGSQRLLTDYHKDAFKSDTVYSIIIPLGNCPRCEAIIPAAVSKLKKADPCKDVQIVVVYPDTFAAKPYIDRYNLKAEHTKFDTEGAYRRIYSCNPGYLHIPYLLKIVPRRGELIAGLRIENVTDDFFQAFCRYSTPVEKYEFPLNGKFAGKYAPAPAPLEECSEVRLNTPDSVKLSEVHSRPEFYGDFLFFHDRLNEAVLGFRYADGKLCMNAFIQADSVQKRKFVHVKDELYQYQLESKAVRFIPICPKIIGGNLFVSYSLPKLWMITPTNMGYMNQACVLKFDLSSVASGSHGEVIPIQMDEKDPKFFDQHFVLNDYSGNVAIACSRMTWPLSFEKADYEGDAERNPFTKEFYKFRQPNLAVFDPDSMNLVGRYEQLPALSEQTLTGYYFMSPTVDSYKGMRAYSDGFTGVINYYADDGGKREYHAFHIDPATLPAPDSTKFYSYDCAKPYLDVFNRNIVELRVTPSHIYCLVRYGKHGYGSLLTDVYAVIAIDKATGLAVEQRFPALTEGTPMAYGLRRNGDEVEPYQICRAEQGVWKLRLFKQI